MSTSRVTEVDYVRAPLGQRAKPALVLSIGVVKPGANHPDKLDYFRAKDGQYAAAFHERFGEQPKEVEIAIPDDLPRVLDLRWKAYGKSPNGNHYLKAIGQSNYVDRAVTGDLSAINGPETVTVWSKDGKKGEIEITGPNDPFVAQAGMKIYTTFRFWIPDVLGLGSWAEIATTSEVSTHNLFAALVQQWRMLRGQWVGLPLVLYLQPSQSRPVVDGKRITSKFWALAVRTPLSVSEFVEQQKALASIQTRPALPPVDHDSVERDLELSPGLWDGESDAARALRESIENLPASPDEPLRTREEPSSVSRADDATANRIAMLRLEIGAPADSLLVGAFGVEDPGQLDADRAAAYLVGLERLHDQAAEHEVVEAPTAAYEEPVEPKLVDGDGNQIEL